MSVLIFGIMSHAVDATSSGVSAQGGRDTIELELSQSDVQLLSASNPECPAASEPIAKDGEWPMHSPPQPKPFELILSLSGAALALLGVVAYLNASALPSRSAQAPNASVSAEMPAPEAAQDLPVRIANPFDPEEVFEFPAGTSEAAARDAAAEILMERARSRRSQGRN